ncbi:30S ribosomal protein S4 [Candidatus Woesearchaeota archaeon]|nr:30S ribosomal protein S4 [Candidatus Woesearchaeota archaeon]
MGDPKKNRKKYSTPSHPWQATRLKEEGELLNRFGLKNKKEVWKMISTIKRFKAQAKSLIASQTEQGEKEKKQLISKLAKLNLISENATLDDVLELKLDSIFERRLQTFVFKLSLAKSIEQARQFIIHGHISIENKRINVPSYLVKKEEETKISFYPNSDLSKEDHPERLTKKLEKDLQKEKEHFMKETNTKEEKLVEVEAK